MRVAIRPLVLASGSPQRRRLLAEAGVEFQVAEPGVAEPPAEAPGDPRSLAAHAAWLKAASVAPRVAAGTIVAADTVVSLAGQAVGKPADRQDARRILQRLSGTEHLVLTALCVWLRPLDCWLGAAASSRVRMRRLTAAQIEAYLATGQWAGKAGAYGVQDPDPHVELLEGSRSNVIGLPMELLERLLAMAEAASREPLAD